MNENSSNSLVKGKCPYWALDSRKECGISKNGLYIPMPQHVRTFCLASKYYQCSQYIKGCDLLMAQEEYETNEFLDSRERRRLRRYSEQLHLDLVTCDRDIGPQEMNFYKAKSLDVSLGGLRVESFEELAKDSFVSFIMDPDFSSKSLLGIGDVKWCEPKINTNRFESGIAFSNYSTSESMKEYLKLECDVE